MNVGKLLDVRELLLALSARLGSRLSTTADPRVMNRSAKVILLPRNKKKKIIIPPLAGITTMIHFFQSRRPVNCKNSLVFAELKKKIFHHPGGCLSRS